MALTKIRRILIIILASLTISSAHSEMSGPFKLQKCCDGDLVLDTSSKTCSQPQNLDRNPLNLGTVLPQPEKEIVSGYGFPKCQAHQVLTLLTNQLLDSELVESNLTESVLSNDQFFIEESTAALIVVESATVYHENFCYERGFTNYGQEFAGTVSLVCQLEPEIECSTRACVRTCCIEGRHFDVKVLGCVANDVFSDDFEVATDEIALPEDARRFYGLPSCAPMHVYDSRKDEIELLHDSGNILIKNTTFNYTQYCIDPNFGENETWTVVFVCAQQVHSELVDLLMAGQLIVKVLFIISIIFLIASFVHIFFKNRKKLFGVMTLCMIAMLFMFYLMLSIPNFLGVNHVLTQPILCKIEALSIQFFYLSAMCWLSAMAFDIWSTFRRFRTRPHDNQGRGIRHPRFKWYALWSWGIPLVVVTVTILMEHLPEHLTDGHKLPQLGQTRCFLGDDGMIFYFHIVNLPILMANLILFTCSSWNLCCGVWSDSDVMKSQTKQRAKTVAKLFFVMGLTWIAELISWVLGRYLEHTILIVKLSLFFDCLNALQGFTLFCALFFDQATMRKIKTQLNTTQWTSIVNTDKIKSRRFTSTTTNLEMVDVVDANNLTASNGSSSKKTVESTHSEQCPTKKKIKTDKKSSSLKLPSSVKDSNQDDSIMIIVTSNQVVKELNQKFEKTKKIADKTSADEKSLQDSSKNNDSVTTTHKNIFRDEASAEKNVAKKSRTFLTLPRSLLLFGRRQRSYTLND